MTPENPLRYEWNMSVPIFKNPLILKQLFFAMGIPFGVLILIFLFAFPAPDNIYAASLVLALLFLTWLFVMLFYRGRYEVHYIIDNQGILCENSPRSARRVKAVGNAAFIIGLATGNLSAAGAGAMSASKTKTYIKRKNIRKIKYSDKNRYILINGGFAQNIAVFCGENYDRVKVLISSGI